MAPSRQGYYRYHDFHHHEIPRARDVAMKESRVTVRSVDLEKKESRVRVRSVDLEKKESRVRVSNGVFEKESKRRKISNSSRIDDEPVEGVLLSPTEEQSLEEGELGLARDIYSSRWAAEEEVVAVVEKAVSSPELGEVVSGDGSENEEESGSDDIDIDVDVAVPPQKRSVNMLQGCRSVDEFRKLGNINEGTYGVVYKAEDVKTGEIVALKKVKMEKEREGFPITALREINILLSFDHPSIVRVKEVVVNKALDGVFMVMEHMENDLKGVMEKRKEPFSQSEVKGLMLQLLEGIRYLHDNWVLHRDLKPSNLLMSKQGELKICDFGLSRQYGSPLKPYTPLVVTLWYRAPELLFGMKEYSTAIDMWSVGCIMAELLAKQPLFNGNTEIDQIQKIVRTLGTPNEQMWPGFAKLPGANIKLVKQPRNKLREKFPAASFYGRQTLSSAGFDLLNKLLAYDPEKRITAEDALKHDWFREIPLPKSKDSVPTFLSQNTTQRCPLGVMEGQQSLEELRRKELQQGLSRSGIHHI